MPHGPTGDIELPTDVLCGHCSHNADCELAKDNLTKCDMYLPGVNSEAVYSGHLYHLDKPELDGAVRCSSCKLNEEGVCDLRGTVPAGYGCIYHQPVDPVHSVKELVEGFEETIAQAFSDLSISLGPHGLAVGDSNIEMKEYIDDGKVLTQRFRTKISVKSREHPE